METNFYGRAPANVSVTFRVSTNIAKFPNLRRQEATRNVIQQERNNHARRFSDGRMTLPACQDPASYRQITDAKEIRELLENMWKKAAEKMDDREHPKVTIWKRELTGKSREACTGLKVKEVLLVVSESKDCLVTFEGRSFGEQITPAFIVPAIVVRNKLRLGELSLKVLMRGITRTVAADWKGNPSELRIEEFSKMVEIFVENCGESLQVEKRELMVFFGQEIDLDELEGNVKVRQEHKSLISEICCMFGGDAEIFKAPQIEREFVEALQELKYGLFTTGKEVLSFATRGWAPYFVPSCYCGVVCFKLHPTVAAATLRFELPSQLEERQEKKVFDLICERNSQIRESQLFLVFRKLVSLEKIRNCVRSNVVSVRENQRPQALYSTPSPNYGRRERDEMYSSVEGENCEEDSMFEGRAGASDRRVQNERTRRRKSPENQEREDFGIVERAIEQSKRRKNT
jgi:hypothetical protein